LSRSLRSVPGERERGGEPGAVLVLGTDQLGLPYGIANRRGGLSEAQAREVLEAAWEEGVRWFDTARAYGESERRLGEFLRSLSAEERREARVATKLEPDAGGPSVGAGGPRASLCRSLSLLGRDRADLFFLHRAGDWTPRVRDDLLRARSEGLLGRVGVSLYDLEEWDRVAGDESPPDVVQAPANLLDFRFASREALRDRLPRRPGAGPVPRLWGRSLFLQGLLAREEESELPDGKEGPCLARGDPLSCADPWLRLPDPEALLRVRAVLRGLARRRGLPLRTLAVAVVRRHFDLEAVLFGAESPEQVRRTAALWREARDTETESVLRDLCAIAAAAPDRLVDPRRWRA